MIKLPVIFVHGLVASGKYYRDYTCVEEYAKSLGINLIIYDRGRFLTLQARVDALKKFFQEASYVLTNGFSGPQNFHVIGHSAGGLDSAFALQEDSYNCISMTAMGSPFLGSPIADLIFERETFDMFVLHRLVKQLDVEQMIKELTTEERRNNVPKLNAETHHYSLPFKVNPRKLAPGDYKNYIKLAGMGHVLSDCTVPTTHQILEGSHVLRPSQVVGDFYEGEHKAQTAPFRYGYFPWSRCWKQSLKVAFDNIAYLEEMRGIK